MGLASEPRTPTFCLPRVVTWDLGVGDVRHDLANADAVTRALDSTVREIGVPAVLVASVGTAGRPSPFHDIEVESITPKGESPK